MKNGDKGFYERKIIYLDYFERGKRIKNGGFIKLEVKREDCRLQVHIRGVQAVDGMQGNIVLVAGDREAAAESVLVQYGVGEALLFWHTDNLAGTGISYENLDGIKIRLTEDRYLAATLRKEGMRQEESTTGETKETPGETEERQERKPVIELAEEAEVRAPVKEAPKETEEDNSPEEDLTETLTQEKEEEEPENHSQEEYPEVRQKEQAEKKNVPERGKLSADKWEQLTRNFPRIHPFKDEREYLSVTPEDFVVLSAKYQNLVHNSFLLHGYYNYGHIALARIWDEKEVKYYIGVPGVYFEQEKQAALLFGFEGFEADKNQVEDGGFGYYMRRVEI